MKKNRVKLVVPDWYLKYTGSLVIEDTSKEMPLQWHRDETAKLLRETRAYLKKAKDDEVGEDEILFLEHRLTYCLQIADTLRHANT